MKIVAVSDSHGNDWDLLAIRERHLQEADLFIHCGDSELLDDDAAMQGYLSVCGNCDYRSQAPLKRVESLAHDVTLFMTHGHTYGVKYSLQKLYYQALEVGANLVCYGHSHYVGAEMIEGILFMNPGNLSFPQNTREKTYAIITVSDRAFEVAYLEGGTGETLIRQTFKR